jgi:hypothetical protein
MDDGKIIPDNTIQKNLNGSYITKVRALPFYDGYYLAVLARPYKYCIINSSFEIVSKLYDDLRIPPSSEITHKPLCLIYGINDKGYGLLDLSDLNISGKITEKTEPKYGLLRWLTPSNYFSGELEGKDKDGYLTTLGWHVLNDAGNLVFNYSKTPKSGHPVPFNDGFIGKPGYMPSTIIYNSNGEITRDYTNVVTPRNPCSGVIIDNDYCIVNEVKVNGFHTKAPLKHHIYNKENKLIFNSASEILWFFPETQLVLTQNGFLNLRGEKHIDTKNNLNFSGFNRVDYWTEKNYEEHGIIQLEKPAQINDKYVTSCLVLDKHGNILLKDIFNLLVFKNGLMSFNDINGYNSIYNLYNNETLTLPKNYTLNLKVSNYEMFSPGYQSHEGLKFINNDFYPEFVYTDPNSNDKYYFDEVGNSSLVVDGNTGFPIEGKKGLRYLLELAPQGSKFYGRVGNKILVAVPKNLLSSDGLKFNSTISASTYKLQNSAKNEVLSMKSDAESREKLNSSDDRGSKIKKEKSDPVGEAVIIGLLKLLFYPGDAGSSENQNSQEKTNYESPHSETLSENFIYICDDCGKMKTHYSEPFDDTPCPETRWGGRGYCSECIGDDGKHQYSRIGRLGKHQYKCNVCHTAISISSEGIQHNGACGGSGLNWSHNWIKEE